MPVSIQPVPERVSIPGGDGPWAVSLSQLLTRTLQDHGYGVNQLIKRAVPDGGSTGQVLAKKSGTTGDLEWVAQSDGSVDESADYNWEGAHTWNTVLKTGATQDQIALYHNSFDEEDRRWNIRYTNDEVQWGLLIEAAESDRDGYFLIDRDGNVHTSNTFTARIPGSGFAQLWQRDGTVYGGVYLTTANTEFTALNGNNLRLRVSSDESRGSDGLLIDGSSGRISLNGGVQGQCTIHGGFENHLYFKRGGGTDFNITRLNSQNGGCSIKLDTGGQAGELNWLDAGINTLYVGGRSLSGVSSRVAADIFYNPSDERFKMDWEPIEDPLGMAQRMAQGRMGWYTHIKTGRRRFGMGAQTAEAEIKELVEEEDGYLAMSYDRLSVLGVAASAQAADEIGELKTETKELKERVKALEVICSTSSK